VVLSLGVAEFALQWYAVSFLLFSKVIDFFFLRSAAFIKKAACREKRKKPWHFLLVS
jgi:hypothetical protein